MKRFYWIFILAHTLLWTVGPALLRPSVTHDTLESITWGLQWQLGYAKHPFLTAWLCAGITELFNTVGWPVYLLAQLTVSATFIATWLLAKKYLPTTQAFIASLLLEGVLFYNINSFNLTPDTLQSPLWAFLALFFYNAITTQKLLPWILTGVCAALCLCTKYQAGLLFITLATFCLSDATARSSFKKPGIYVALMTFIVLCAPHLYWLYTHDFMPLNYALHTPKEYTHNDTYWNHIGYFFRFAINNLLDVAGVFVLMWPFLTTQHVRRASISIKNLDVFKWRFLLFLSFGPLGLSILLCLLSGDYFPPRWSTPYFFPLGILLMVLISPTLTQRTQKQWMVTLISYSLLIFSLRMGVIGLQLRPQSDAYLPNREIAHTLAALWHERYHAPLPYLAGSRYLVSVITPYIPEHPKPYLNWDSQDSPWINEQQLKRQGALFIWDINSNYVWDKASTNCTELTPTIKARFPNIILLPNRIFYRKNNHPIVIGVAILPPEVK
jgi:4-amino-4-deoxy-L-arabinose transferase-like glycosyltransferase